MTATPTTTGPAIEADSEAASPSKVPIYETSTQYRNWRFSMESLAQLRGSMNEVAVEAIRKKIEADEVRRLLRASWCISRTRRGSQDPQ
jgi:hypothetical protein